MKKQKERRKINKLNPNETGILYFPKSFFDELPGYTTKRIKTTKKDFLLTTNDKNGKFAIAPVNAVGLSHYEDGDYIPINEFSPEDVCARLLQEDKTEYFAGFVESNFFSGYKIEWIKDKDEAIKKLKMIL